MRVAEEVAVSEVTFVKNEGLFPWWVILLWGILTLILGVMFLKSPRITTVLMVTFMGAFWLVGGLFSLGSLVVDRTNLGWKFFLAIINIIAGALIMLYPFYSTVFILSFFVIFLGFYACFIGFAHLFHAFRQKDAGNGILGIISLIFGILLLIYPMIAASLIPFLAGAFCIVAGFCAIAASFMAKKVQTPVNA